MVQHTMGPEQMVFLSGRYISYPTGKCLVAVWLQALTCLYCAFDTVSGEERLESCPADPSAAFCCTGTIGNRAQSG